MKQSLAVVLGIALLGAMAVAPARAAAKDSTSQEVAYGAGSFFGTLLYAPFKTSFCVVGAVTSGLTLPFGGTQTAGKVASATEVVEMQRLARTLKGQEPVRFVGQ